MALSVHEKKASNFFYLGTPAKSLKIFLQSSKKTQCSDVHREWCRVFIKTSLLFLRKRQKYAVILQKSWLCVSLRFCAFAKRFFIGQLF
jgi:hypothetical protein